jgi:hypothetical protein
LFEFFDYLLVTRKLLYVSSRPAWFDTVKF